MPALDLRRIRAFTFDCYGTLVDWLGGVEAAMRAMPSLEGVERKRLLVDRENVELEMLAGPYRPYGEVLAISMARAARLQEREPSPEELASLREGMGDWPPFDETPLALQRLREHARLAVLSNVENATLARTLERLDVPVDVTVTAEDVRSYKPATAHFDVALERLDLERDEVVHVAQSLRHDLRPAGRLGWRTVWINRLAEGQPVDIKPTLVVPSLTALLDELGA